MPSSSPFLFFFLLFLVACKNKQEGIVMVSPQQVYEAIYGASSSEGQLIDVRTSEEYSVSHLKEAQNICVSSPDFQEKVAALDKSKPVYVYCKGGRRSAKAAQILRDMGFLEVYDLDGGLKKWQREGLEVEH